MKVIKENKIIIILILLILAIGGIILLSGEGEQIITLEEQFQDSPELITERVGEPEYPEEVVLSFVDNFIKTAPPESDQQALDLAVSLLSEEAKAEIGDDPTSGDLAMFVGVQDIPDQGYQITGIEFTDEIDQGVAQVEVIFKYTGGDTIRNFELSKIDGNWLINSID